MIIMLFFLVIIVYALSFVAWRLAACRVTWYSWEYGAPVYGITVWIFLTVIHVGQTASLSNFVVEVFWVTVASALSPWARIVFPGKSRTGSLVSSWVGILIPVAVSLCLRLLMPTLPE